MTTKRPCPRCGMLRAVHHTRPDIVCKDCRATEHAEALERGKYLHRFPILDPDRDTSDLIAEGRRLLRRIAPKGYVLTRCEWNRRDDELILLADAVPEVDAEDIELAENREPMRWVRDGLVWRAVKRAAA